MALQNIAPFRGLRDGKEDPEEYVKNVEFIARNFHSEQQGTRLEDSMRIIFRLNLADTARAWYTSLPSVTKASWQELQQRFKEAYKIKPKDVEAEKLEILHEIIRLQQQSNEKLRDYIHRVDELARRSPESDLAIAFHFVHGLLPTPQKEYIKYDLGKATHYSYEQAKKCAESADNLRRESELGWPTQGIATAGRQQEGTRAIGLGGQEIRDDSQGVIPELVRQVKDLAAKLDRVQGRRGEDYSPPPRASF
ncbi:MAG: hypothetical protein M1823_004444, partial [Watsoniomyces obsoletus]